MKIILKIFILFYFIYIDIHFKADILVPQSPGDGITSLCIILYLITFISFQTHINILLNM